MEVLSRDTVDSKGKGKGGFCYWWMRMGWDEDEDIRSSRDVCNF